MTVHRKSLLVGSIPAADTDDAVRCAMDEMGSLLIAVPDGETGERKAWVGAIIDRLSSNPAFQLKKAGRWTGYDDVPEYRVRRRMRVDPDSLALGYYDAFQLSRPVIEAAASTRDLVGLPLQVGVVSAFDLTLFSQGWTGALRHRGPFNVATAREIAAIRSERAGDVIFQIEIPAELVAVARSPRLIRPAVARWMGRMAVELTRSVSPGTRFGIHLCYGDLGNHSFITGLRDCAAAVALTNAIVASWPSTVSLEYVHLPLAAGDEPPSLDATYYAPLSDLRLPPLTRLVAGFVHEGLSEDQLRDVLILVESARHGRVDIAAACGLGRREPNVARTIMKRTRILCEAPRPA
ncbi:hypothetical protein M1247_33920 [Mycobacterium sp. 21AC1]|uniref:hypothetical protein n=1 Tax=[Mycobacterium] appelbergii TaxID=2939269 RepID=UPI0029393708|nr:hypothetical protein [Mycobacterium sp. 21AC1]MDV3129943.1 hypothetical protein [Mycobacterium sp. 21AC1]